MSFLLTDEQTDLQALLTQFATRHASVAQTRAAMAAADGYDPATWTRLCGELELTRLGVPEEHGGYGAGPAEALLALEILGAQLYGGPYLATFLAAQAIVLAADPGTAAELLAPIADGDRLATLAALGADGTPVADGVLGVRASDRWELTGRRAHVLNGDVADWLVVTATCEEGPGIFLVETDHSRVGRAVLPTLDPTRRVARVDLDHAPARLLCVGPAAATALARLAEIGALAVAAEQVGGARACLDMTVEYVRTRHQFGRPIGSFQAVQFTCADMFAKVEDAGTAVRYAVSVLAQGDDRAFAEAASIAKAFCSDAFVSVSGDALQLHGGIGFTAEHDVHLFLRRARADAALFGDAHAHRERLAALLEL